MLKIQHGSDEEGRHGEQQLDERADEALHGAARARREQAGDEAGKADSNAPAERSVGAKPGAPG